MSQRYFATIAPGLEQALLDEVRELGGKKPKVHPGGVEFDATNTKLYRALYTFRCANRILLRVDEFRARDKPELYNKTRRFPWERLLGEELTLYVNASASGSRLIHTAAIAQAVADGIRDHFREDLGARPPSFTDHPRGGAMRLQARVSEDRCELSLDAAGKLLHKRGWRERSVEAPIRETTAAALLRLAKWSPDEPIVDPMCGSGTFVIEAAQRAGNVPPGIDRDFDVQRWANFQAQTWAEVTDEIDRERLDPQPIFFGFDRDAEAIEAARHNAGQALVTHFTSFEEAEAGELLPPAALDGMTGLMLTNPPYGKRIGTDALDSVQAMIARFAESWQGWRLGFLAPEGFTPKHAALSFEARLRFRNGGLPVTLWMGRHR